MALSGKIKWYDYKKGYGFIVGEDKSEIFFHVSDLVSKKEKKLPDGQPVQYEIGTSPRGPKAINILVLPLEGVL